MGILVCLPSEFVSVDVLAECMTRAAQEFHDQDGLAFQMATIQARDRIAKLYGLGKLDARLKTTKARAQFGIPHVNQVLFYLGDLEASDALRDGMFTFRVVIKDLDPKGYTTSTFSVEQLAEREQDQAKERACQAKGLFTLAAMAMRLSEHIGSDASTVLDTLVQEVAAGRIKARDAKGWPIPVGGPLRTFLHYVMLSEVNRFLAERLELEPFVFASQATPEVQPVDVPSPSLAEARPLPSPVVAAMFGLDGKAGIRWTHARWGKMLGDPDVWLANCRAEKGLRGRNNPRSTWWPLKLADALRERDIATISAIRGCFHAMAANPQVAEWLPSIDQWAEERSNAEQFGM